MGVLAASTVLPRPYLLHCVITQPALTPRATEPAVSRFSLPSYRVYFPFFLNSRGINRFALLPESHLLPWGKTSANCSGAPGEVGTGTIPATGRVLPSLQHQEKAQDPTGAFPRELVSDHPVPGSCVHTVHLLSCEHYAKRNLKMFGCLCTYVFYHMEIKVHPTALHSKTQGRAQPPKAQGFSPPSSPSPESEDGASGFPSLKLLLQMFRSRGEGGH